LIKLTEG